MELTLNGVLIAVALALSFGIFVKSLLVYMKETVCRRTYWDGELEQHLYLTPSWLYPTFWGVVFILIFTYTIKF